MCGIAGWLGETSQAAEICRRLSQRLSHRGPDACGSKEWAGAALVHTRLSILDLSPAGAQPMSNEDGSVWVAFNGEIYNHHQLREWLESKGHSFRGRSDTEILPHLYEEEGAEFLPRLRGMFAIAIYDSRSRVLLLARDRFGIKPLFYTIEKGRVAFASELNALREVPGVDLAVDRQAVQDFAALACIPAPLTFYRGMAALEPGQVLLARASANDVTWTLRRFHNFAIEQDDGISYGDACDHTEELIGKAVTSQLESDVPLGCLLSGGIDSSLVSVAAQRGMSTRLQTYNVQFSDAEYDETWAAQDVAAHIGSEHKTLPMPEAGGGWEQITSLLLHCGQPFADTSLFAVDEVCREMRRQVSVALSGDGGDEAFGGYYFHWKARDIGQLQRLPSWCLRAAGMALRPSAMLGIVPNRYPMQLEAYSNKDRTSTMRSLLSWLPPKVHSQLCRDRTMLPVSRHYEQKWKHDLRNATLPEKLFAHATEVNTRLILPNDLLFKVDTASMRASLEVRVPMLDEALYDFGLGLPSRLKVKNRQCKLLLREVARRQIPSRVADKPKKGFAVPVDRWVGPAFREQLRDTLLGKSSHLSEYYDPKVYTPWVTSFAEAGDCKGLSRGELDYRVIMLLGLELFLSLAPARQG